MEQIKDQPPPMPQPERAPVWDLVLDDINGKPGPTWQRIRVDMVDRDKLGRERYGTPLTTGNGRDHLVDAYQEALDLAVYLRAQLEEQREHLGSWAEATPLVRLYYSHLDNLHTLRTIIDGR